MRKHAPRARPPHRDECLAMNRLCLSANLRRTERLVTRHYDAYLAEAGVTAVQLPILAIIASAPEPTFRLLTEVLELERSTLSRNLALLERLDYVAIGPSSGPKPGLLALTDQGTDVLARAHRQWKRAHRALVTAFDDEAITSGMGFLKHLRGRARRTPASAAGSRPKRAIR